MDINIFVMQMLKETHSGFLLLIKSGKSKLHINVFESLQVIMNHVAKQSVHLKRPKAFHDVVGWCLGFG